MNGSTSKSGSSAETAASDKELQDALRKRQEKQQDSADDIHHQIEELQSKYAAERDKRLRSDGLDQYIDTYTSPRFKHFSDDPFAADEPHFGKQSPAKNGDEIPYFVMGAGMAGLCVAVRLVKSGVSPSDIRVVDGAGGFGGTWYWNRYPGVACDIESYIYLPFLEETGYVPKHRYSYGSEIRAYLNLAADQYDLRRNSMFSTNVISAHWDEDRKRWTMVIQPCGSSEKVTVYSKFAFFAPGVLHMPKIPNSPGLEDFRGDMFHTSRWDYTLTGGSEQQPDMTKLKDKNVAVIGTGATAIQLVPRLAKWAKKLYVVQRTPSAVDWRGQRETDPESFRTEIASQPGWQHERYLNFSKFISNHPKVPSMNLVNDAWTYAPSLQALVGTMDGPSKPEDIPEFVGGLHKLDFARQEQIRQHVDEIVKDPATAQNLKAWYPGWCKRPAFSDEYLPAFNLANVELVDSNGNGIEKFTEGGLVVNGRELLVDLVVLGTGYRNPATTPAKRADIDILGRNGLPLDEKYEARWSSLHGCLSADFPNMFLFLMNQWGNSTNYSGCMDRMAEHVVHILEQAARLHPEAGDLGRSSIVIEPTKEAEEAWAGRIAMGAMSFAALAGCTPGYYNAEGGADRLSMEDRMLQARKATWGGGWASFLQVIEAWEDGAKLEGIDITF